MVMGEETLETQVVVIGGGPGGYSAAFRAADLGLEVTLVTDEQQLGGVCLHRGCIPSKVLLQATRLLHEAEQAGDWGIAFDRPEIDLDALRSRKDKVVRKLAGGLTQLARKRGVHMIHARAAFEDGQHLRLQGADIARIQFENAIIAAGSCPIPLADAAFSASERLMASDDALQLESIPETLLVVGGSSIGLGQGSIYASLGSRVTLVEITDQLLPGVDRELTKPFVRRAKTLFENIYLKTKVDHVQVEEDSLRVTFTGQAEYPEEQQFERAVIAIGRRPNSEDLGLHEAGVDVDERGFIFTDEQMRTSQKHIFAIGDVAGQPLYAHTAMREGKIAAEVIAGEPAAFDVRCVPAVIYIEPEVAWCGLMEREARERGRSIRVSRFPWRASGRALTKDAEEGLTKLIFDAETERLLGVGIAGRGAENLIAEGALAIEMGAVAEDLALTLHPHPTLSETEAEAAEAFLGQATHVLSRGQR